MNNALLGKWLWRLGDDAHGMWHRLVMAKYRLVSTSSKVPDVTWHWVYGSSFCLLKLNLTVPLLSG